MYCTRAGVERNESANESAKKNPHDEVETRQAELSTPVTTMENESTLRSGVSDGRLKLLRYAFVLYQPQICRQKSHGNGVEVGVRHDVFFQKSHD